jgi:hypothetical protein
LRKWFDPFLAFVGNYELWRNATRNLQRQTASAGVTPLPAFDSERRCNVAQQQIESSLAKIARAAAVLFDDECMPISVSVWYSDGTAWQSGLGCQSRSQPEWESVLAETLRSALERMHRGDLMPIGVMIWFSDRSWLQRGLPEGERAEAEEVDELSQCKQDITSVLREAGERLTTTRVLEQLHARDLIWGESTTKRALAEMVRDGELTNRRDTRPRGYGLPAWH